ncbi:MAG: hypothetical protein E4H41_06300 [Gemmatimonadales bacterium]|jgi:hypothetical protein|nr:MAG: hypothetical protein E4H41_06300 [Gemmatimonadales bacterium]
MTAPTAPTPERSALWEDFLEIFVKPSAVFERRKDAGFFVPLLIFLVLFLAIWFGLKGAFQPIMDAEISRGIAKAMAKNPQMTEEIASGMRAASEKFAVIGILVSLPVVVLLLGLTTWVAGKIVGAAVSLGAAMMIATYSYFPRILELLASGAQALLLPEEQLTGEASVKLGVARAFDPDTTSAVLMATLMRVDVFTLWVTFLIAVGLHVVGKIPMNKALLGGAIVWVIGALPKILPAMISG